MVFCSLIKVRIAVMRKNFIFLAVLLVLISAMVFVACDDPGNSGNNPSNPTTDASAKLKEGMTIGEVKAVLYEAKNVTIEKRVNNVLEYSAKLSASGYSLSDSVKNTLESSFVEGNKLYRFYVNGDAIDFNVYDVTGYDLRFGADCAKIVKGNLEDLYAGMVENGFRIANNELSVTSVSDKGVVKVSSRTLTIRRSIFRNSTTIISSWQRRTPCFRMRISTKIRAN